MIFRNKKLNKGFTLIELLVVIAIIAILSSVVVVSVISVRARARDARRKSDLEQIRIALNLYYDKKGHWMTTGCGNNGGGYFNKTQPPIYPKSLAQCLIDEKLTPREIIDPTGGREYSASTQFFYMKYTCTTPKATYLFARLETKPKGSAAGGETNGVCSSPNLDTLDSSYGINHKVRVD
jgi:prepilin-type N-terminal cleavage/methylation domain-containing protein